MRRLTTPSAGARTAVRSRLTLRLFERRARLQHLRRRRPPRALRMSAICCGAVEAACVCACAWRERRRDLRAPGVGDVEVGLLLADGGLGRLDGGVARPAPSDVAASNCWRGISSLAASGAQPIEILRRARGVGDRPRQPRARRRELRVRRIDLALGGAQRRLGAARARLGDVLSARRARRRSPARRCCAARAAASADAEIGLGARHRELRSRADRSRRARRPPSPPGCR